MNETQTDVGLDEHLAQTLRLRLEERRRLPVSTYRLQFHAGFTFRDAQAIVPYLATLGITDCYCSPYLRARPGSTHGYDICDHNHLNPELGAEADFQAFVDELKAHNLGQILDFVPNHMAADPDMNPWWREVLEDGQASPYAWFFDIDWHPIKRELQGKVLLPFLGDHYGLVLERGELKLTFENGAVVLRYHDRTWPINPGQSVKILRNDWAGLEADLGKDDPAILEFAVVLSALENLPHIPERDFAAMAERLRQKQAIRERLQRLLETSPRIQQHIEDTLRALNGQPGQPHSFDRLHEILEAQAYRLAYWRTASDEINYRRFFDIKELAGLRMEEPALFTAAHQLVLRLIREQKITGLRLDHLDGLFDPAGYLEELQEAVIQEWLSDLKPRDISPEAWRRQLRTWRASERQQDRAGLAACPLFIAIEKILMGDEALPKSWPIHGTSGYVFLNDVDRLFVPPENAKAMTAVYERFTGMTQSFADVVYECKRLLTWTAMASELNVLADAMNRLSEGNRRARDFTLSYLREALRETVACFPVYRTYVSAAGAAEADRLVIDLALARARRRNPAMEPLVFGFLRQVLLPRPTEDEQKQMKIEDRGSKIEHDGVVPPSATLHSQSPVPALPEDEYSRRLEFAMKFQQYTGPVQAKGVEDTAFYRYNRLLSLNEVGGDPQRFGDPPEKFHQANLVRLTYWPHAMLATATHDTKRGEDARARLNVLSEMPTDWRRALFQWSRINTANRTLIQGEHAPHRNDEYLFYQALLGAWPDDHSPLTIHHSPTAPPDLIERLKQYMLKAVHEAKVFTSWINPNEAYDQAVADFVTKTLTGRRAPKFLASFLPFEQKIARLGMINSLAQVVLKIISPGVPDFYQGTELWDLSLVDPDNRRPVDFDHRRRLLESLEPLLNPKSQVANSKSQVASPEAGTGNLEFGISDLLRSWFDGRIKLLITAAGLRLRREWPQVFKHGEYLPLEVIGEKADHVVAVARRHHDHLIVAIVPRLVAGLVQASTEQGPGPELDDEMAYDPATEPPGGTEHHGGTLNGGTDSQSVHSWLPVGPDIWKTTRVILPPDSFIPHPSSLSFRNVITQESAPITASPSPRLVPSLLVSHALAICPVALLEARLAPVS
jgi:(1->4)-alpha-D-glucan 1-alpha-D-glucosylmutase